MKISIIQVWQGILILPPNGNDEFTDFSTPAATVQVGFLGLQNH